MRKNKYSIIKMRNNYTKKEFDIDIEVTFNNPIMFTQVKNGDNKGMFQMRLIRKSDIEDINWRE